MSPTIFGASDECHVLVAAKAMLNGYALNGYDVGDERLYRVPLPRLRVVGYSPIDVRLEMSGDGENWIAAQFPHICDGFFQGGCVRAADGTRLTAPRAVFDYDFDNVPLIISQAGINYIYDVVRQFWRPLIRGNGNRDDNHSFMEAWENVTHEQMNEFLLKKAPVR
jgi:hypothetical protein